MSSVSLSSVSVRFDTGSFGLSDVDLDVADGEFLSLVGPSGSGKTTLLRTIAGFSARTLGEVRIGGQVVAGARSFDPPERRGLGMVFRSMPCGRIGTSAETSSTRSGGLASTGPNGTECRRGARARPASPDWPPAGRRRSRAVSGSGIALARRARRPPRVLLLDEALSALDEPLP
ncbi:ATP-binding cassette domain-containing protein [Brevibacterium casei]|uniref:ATP-binding cassette domain-containing protein n=1 Tax=Brevibacterium casei TaxID=33889 RepID=UPI0037BE3340